jgi:hypothetical protein
MNRSAFRLLILALGARLRQRGNRRERSFPSPLLPHFPLYGTVREAQNLL